MESNKTSACVLPRSPSEQFDPLCSFGSQSPVHPNTGEVTFHQGFFSICGIVTDADAPTDGGFFYAQWFDARFRQSRTTCAGMHSKAPFPIVMTDFGSNFPHISGSRYHLALFER